MKQLPEPYRLIRQEVYDHFNTTDKWPLTCELVVKFRGLGNFYEITKKISSDVIVVEDEYKKDAETRLTFNGIACCKGSEEDLEGLLKVAGLFIGTYIKHRRDAKVSTDDFSRDLCMAEEKALRITRHIWENGMFYGGGSRTPDCKANFRITNRILQFEKIYRHMHLTSLKDFWSSKFSA